MATKNVGVWGIDLGQCALKAVRLEQANGKVTATAFDFIEHPKILSQPDADPDELTRAALEKFLERNDLKTDTVAIGVPGQSGLARFVKLPPVEQKKVHDIVRFEAKQQIPFPLEEVVWDYQKLGQGMVTDGYAMDTEIGLFAMKRDVVSRALQQFTDVNVEVHIVQMSPLALLNFVSYDLLMKDVKTDGDGAEEDEPDSSREKPCVVALDIGADSSNLVITDGERIIWQRPLPMGGNRFTRELTRELKLTFAKAEHIKRNAIKSQDLRKILLALRPALNEFVNEVQRSLGYFMNTHRNTKVKYMVGLGNAFRLPGLQKFLQEKLQLPVKKIPSMRRLEGEDVTSQPQFKENILSFGVAYGLALQGLEQTRIQTNLLPEEIRTERMVRAKKPWAVATAAALLLAIAGYTFAQAVPYGIYSKAINDKLKKALGRAKAAEDLAAQNESAHQTQLDKIKKAKSAVNRIASGVEERFNWNLIYKYINDCMPQADPDNSKVTIVSSDNFKARSYYLDANARDAWERWLDKLSSSPDDEIDPKKEREDDLFIKKHMVQVNLAGVTCLYADDLSKFFDSLKTQNNTNLMGLSPAEKKNVQEKNGLPAKGWVFEIRGYTYWHPRPSDDPTKFVLRTLVQNLRDPKDPARAKYNPKLVLSDDIHERVVKNVSYAVLYKKQKVNNPAPGSLDLAGRSHLKGLISGTGGGGNAGGGTGVADAGGGMPASGGGDQQPNQSSADGRNSWAPLGEIASSVFAGSGKDTGTDGGAMTGGGPPEADGGSPEAGGGATPSAISESSPRTEFIIFFVWQEPSSLEEGTSP